MSAKGAEDSGTGTEATICVGTVSERCVSAADTVGLGAEGVLSTEKTCVSSIQVGECSNRSHYPVSSSLTCTPSNVAGSRELPIELASNICLPAQLLVSGIRVIGLKGKSGTIQSSYVIFTGEDGMYYSIPYRTLATVLGQEVMKQAMHRYDKGKVPCVKP